MSEDLKWQYCGDGVYAGFDGCGIWLHANDHKNPTDRIYLEPSVLECLNLVYQAHIQSTAKETEDDQK